MPKINIQFFPNEKKIMLNDYALHCPSEGAASALTRKNILGAIMAGQYEFQSDRDDPFIIDCGSEIGIVTFVFKVQYPNAKILCFEPDPIAFKFLEKNILENS